VNRLRDIRTGALFPRPEGAERAEDGQHRAADVEIYRPIRRRTGDRLFYLRTNRMGYIVSPHEQHHSDDEAGNSNGFLHNFLSGFENDRGDLSPFPPDETQEKEQENRAQKGADQVADHSSK
jgi:hypothetical protein